jgi:hypothetical protein
VDVEEASNREGKFAKGSDGIAGNFGVSSGLANSGPSSAVFLNGWPHKALGDEFSHSLDSWVTEDEGNQIPDGGEKGCKVVVLLQKCRSRVQRRYLGCGFSAAAVLWSPTGGWSTPCPCPELLLVPRRLLARQRTLLSTMSQRRCADQICDECPL